MDGSARGASMTYKSISLNIYVLHKLRFCSLPYRQSSFEAHLDEYIEALVTLSKIALGLHNIIALIFSNHDPLWDLPTQYNQLSIYRNYHNNWHNHQCTAWWGRNKDIPYGRPLPQIGHPCYMYTKNHW